MKCIVMCNGYEADIVKVPDFIADNLELYAVKFSSWLGHGEHDLYEVDPEGGVGYSFGSEDVVGWMDDVVLADSDECCEFAECYLEPTRELLEKYPVFHI